MLKIISADGNREYAALSRIRKRGEKEGKKVQRAVESVIAEVRKNGDDALYEYSRTFDHVELSSLEIERAELESAAAKCDPKVRKALEAAAENIRDFHRRQLMESHLSFENGRILGVKVRPLKRVGVYVPGGLAAYPSSVLMNIIPAKIAGVSEIIMVTPPKADGIAPAVAAAALIAGADRAFRVGGAQAIAALAYGTQSVPRVDKIVGPGNSFVATAKRLVYGAVDIDSVAGPSEILVLADKTADPSYIAADMLSQAEHGADSSSILITDSRTIAKKAALELSRQLEALPRAQLARQSLESYGLIVCCSDMDECVRLANEAAPEHLEVLCAEPFGFVEKLDNAGALFLGHFTPEAAGDYMAGPNHVLPTGGTARFFSPLSVDHFVKKCSILSYTKEALLHDRGDIIALAECEGLTAHAESVRIRKTQA